MKGVSKRLWGLAAGLLGLALMPSAAVWAANNAIASTVRPQIGQIGTTFDVLIEGASLEKPQDLLFYRPGFSCRKLVPVTLGLAEKGRQAKFKRGQAILATIQVAADVEPGECLFRVRTDHALSELVSLWVTRLPVVAEEYPWADASEGLENRNDTRETAQRIPLNCTVVGYQQTWTENDRDCYLVALEKGQRCTAEIVSSRLGTHHGMGITDMVLEVFGPTGERVAFCDDTPLFGQDPIVSFLAPASGDYLIVTQQQLGGNDSFRHYALNVSDSPQPAAVFPLGGTAGSEIDLRIDFLDGTSATHRITLPIDVGRYEASWVPLERMLPLGMVTPGNTRLRVAPAGFVQVLEAGESHGKEETAQVIEADLPIAINGTIAERGEIDWYRFRAREGQRYRLRTYARTLGSPLDAIVKIHPVNPNKVQRTWHQDTYDEDDSQWAGHDMCGHHYRHQVQDRLDTIFMFEPRGDGEYLIGIGDKTRKHGRDYHYRVEFVPFEEQLFAAFPSSPNGLRLHRSTMMVHSGATAVRTLEINPVLGVKYEGLVSFEARGLPPGVHFECQPFKNHKIGNGRGTVLATITADPGTPPWQGLIDLVPIAVSLDNKELPGGYVCNIGANNQGGDYAMHFRRNRQCPVAVTDPAPFTIRIEPPQGGLVQNSEVDLTIHVDRQPGFDAALYVESYWLPSGIGVQPPLIVPGGEAQARYRLTVSKNAPPGKRRFTLTAREEKGGNVSTGAGFHYVSAPPIDLDVVEPFVELAFERAAIPRGTSGSLRLRLKQVRPFPGKATVTLLRLPTGVSQVGEASFTASDTAVDIPVKIAADALVNQYKGIGARVTITAAGETVMQLASDGVLRIDAK